MNESVVDVEGLTKAFGAGPRATHALTGLDLTVEPGQVVGFLGPNGAGKTTTLRILLGLIRADGGRARLFGRDPWNDAVPLHRGRRTVVYQVTVADEDERTIAVGTLRSLFT